MVLRTRLVYGAVGISVVVVGPSSFPFCVLKWLSIEMTATWSMTASGSNFAPAWTRHGFLSDVPQQTAKECCGYANEGNDQKEPVETKWFHLDSLVCPDCFSEVSSGLQRINSVDVSAAHTLIGLMTRSILRQGNYVGGGAPWFWTKVLFLFSGRKKNNGAHKEQHAEDEDDASQARKLQA